MRPPSTKPGDTIHLPGGQPARVVESFVTDTPAKRKDGTHYGLRYGVLIVGPIA